MRCRETRARSPARGLATSAETLGDASQTGGSRVVEARVEARGVKVVLGRARVPRERHLDRGVVDVETTERGIAEWTCDVPAETSRRERLVASTVIDGARAIRGIRFEIRVENIAEMSQYAQFNRRSLGVRVE